MEMAALRSWSEDESRKHFSGQATYEKTVKVPTVAGRVFLNFGEGTRAMLDGPARDAAVVWVDGKRAGAVWCSPYEVEVTGAAARGGEYDPCGGGEPGVHGADGEVRGAVPGAGYAGGRAAALRVVGDGEVGGAVGVFNPERGDE